MESLWPINNFLLIRLRAWLIYILVLESCWKLLLWVVRNVEYHWCISLWSLTSCFIKTEEFRKNVVY